MKKTISVRIICWFILSVLIVGAIPFTLLTDEYDIKEKFALSFDMLRTASIIIGAFLALVFFDPMGIRKKTAEKQYENVVKTLDVCVTLPLNALSYRREAENYQFVGAINLYLTAKEIHRTLANGWGSFEGNERYLDWPIAFEPDHYFEAFNPLLKLQSSIWTPKPIADAIQLVHYSHLSNETANSGIVALWFGKPKKASESELFYSLNNQVITLKTFLINYRSIEDACLTWLDENSFSKRDLNI